MNQVELLRHVADNIEAGKPAGHGLLFDGEKSEVQTANAIAFNRPWRYSLAPRTRLINGIECPMPLEVKPEQGSKYWYESPADYELAGWLTWEGDRADLRLFKRGMCYTTQEAALMSCKARYGIVD